MANLSSIQSTTVYLPPRLVLMGGEKRGKSTLASQFPSPVFLPVAGETGVDEIAVPKFPAASEYGDLLESVEQLATEEHEFKTIVIDSISALEPIVGDYAMKIEKKSSISQLGGGFGGQETALCNYWRMLLDRLDYIRTARQIGVILIGHVKPVPKVVNDPLSDPYDAWRMELRESVQGLVYRWSDLILFLDIKKYQKTVGKQGRETTHAITTGERVLYTQWEPSHPGGGRGRFGSLPAQLPCSYEALANAIDAVTPKQN